MQREYWVDGSENSENENALECGEAESNLKVGYGIELRKRVWILSAPRYDMRREKWRGLYKRDGY